MISAHLRQARRCVAALALVALGGCAGAPTISVSEWIGTAGEPGRCAEFLADLDRVAADTGSLDAGEHRVEGYPWLRVNRLLASYRDEVAGEPAFSAWLDHLQGLDLAARGHEIANLPERSWNDRLPGMDRADLLRRAQVCSRVLRQTDRESPALRARLRARAVVPDEYRLLPRVLGLYPVTRMLVAYGVDLWHRRTRHTFSIEPPPNWRTLRYRYADSRPTVAELRAILRRTPHDALGFPRFDDAARRVLFAYYAPLWAVRRHGDDDRIGAPYWRRPGEPAVRISEPVSFVRLSHTRFQGRLLTQLNYVIWFPARTAQSGLDIYAGPLDGVTLRVTLDARGDPLLYETIHNCGCYYKAYPTRRLKVRADIDYAEPPLILTAPTFDPDTQTLVVAMRDGSHFVEHLFTEPRTAKGSASNLGYRLRDYGWLLSLDDGAGGHENLFGDRGTVSASARPERFILWPTGVASPGAMRQWGRHAVAFVGERHFDDPDALDRMFVPAGVDRE